MPTNETRADRAIRTLADYFEDNLEQAVALSELVPEDLDSGQPEDFFVCFVCDGHVEDIKTW